MTDDEARGRPHAAAEAVRATVALAGGEDVETVEGELVEAVREVARDHGRMLGLAVEEMAGRA